jgi:hypothetical protein
LCENNDKFAIDRLLPEIEPGDLVVIHDTGQARAKPADVRTIEKGLWIDTLRPASEENRRRSVDVLITRAVPKAIELGKDDEETDLVVEILSIEINDPGGARP